MEPEIEWVKYLFKKLNFLGFWKYLEINPNITFENMKYLSRRFDYDNLSCNPNITMDIVNNNRHYNPYKQWSYGRLSENPSITWSDICTKKEKAWYRDEVIKKESVIFDIVLNNLDFFVEKDLKCFSQNPNLTLDIILNYPQYMNYWNFYYVSKNKNITFEMILANKQLKWDFRGICENPNVTWDVIKKYEYRIKWRYDLLSLNPNITWDIVLNNLDKNWSFARLSMNPNITWDIIINNPQYKWNFKVFLWNKNLTLKTLEYIMSIIKEDEISNYDCIAVCKLEFKEDKEEFIKKYNEKLAQIEG
jgi:hypothetical protein